MIQRNEEERHGEGKAQRSGDHWGVEVIGTPGTGPLLLPLKAHAGRHPLDPKAESN
jgi:hypothetical protein